jgi:hypothetical protein
MIDGHGLQTSPVARSAKRDAPDVGPKACRHARQRMVVTGQEHTHQIRLWVSTHDNGWEAWVAQHDDGTFTAWACRATEDAIATYIEDSFEHACAAALFDLSRLSGHGACGPNRTTWQERDTSS